MADGYPGVEDPQRADRCIPGRRAERGRHWLLDGLRNRSLRERVGADAGDGGNDADQQRDASGGEVSSEASGHVVKL